MWWWNWIVSEAWLLFVVVEVCAVDEEEEDSGDEGQAAPSYGHPETPA